MVPLAIRQVKATGIRQLKQVYLYKNGRRCRRWEVGVHPHTPDFWANWQVLGKRGYFLALLTYQIVVKLLNKLLGCPKSLGQISFTPQPPPSSKSSQCLWSNWALFEIDYMGSKFYTQYMPWTLPCLQETWRKFESASSGLHVGTEDITAFEFAALFHRYFINV